MNATCTLDLIQERDTTVEHYKGVIQQLHTLWHDAKKDKRVLTKRIAVFPTEVAEAAARVPHP